MIFIVTALLIEAKPIIEKYKLVKISDKPFKVFQKDDMILIISGIGKINSASATAHILSKNKHEKDSMIVNFGICAAKKTHKIGDMIFIKAVIDKGSGKKYTLDKKDGCNITCFDSAQPEKTPKTELADMESSGFFLAARKFLPNSNISIIKIVSDHFCDQIPTERFMEELIGKNMENLEKILRENA